MIGWPESAVCTLARVGHLGRNGQPSHSIGTKNLPTGCATSIFVPSIFLHHFNCLSEKILVQLMLLYSFSYYLRFFSFHIWVLDKIIVILFYYCTDHVWNYTLVWVIYYRVVYTAHFNYPLNPQKFETTILIEKNEIKHFSCFIIQKALL